MEDGSDVMARGQGIERRIGIALVLVGGLIDEGHDAGESGCRGRGSAYDLLTGLGIDQVPVVACG
jgi:hypothetical protein